MSLNISRLSIIAGSIIATQSAFATIFTSYNASNGYLGNGSELAAALLQPGGSVNIIDSSSSFLGNFNGVFTGGDGGGPDGPLPEGGEFPVPTAIAASGSPAASAAFFSGLNFGSAGGFDFILPDGILLTSGEANIADFNSQSGFSGDASGLGDAGLDALLSANGFSDSTSDATVLAFDFEVGADINAVALDFIFGSEEFPEFADSFPEIAAIFVDGTNAAGFGDGSLLTVTSAGIASGNFVDNNGNNAGGTSPLAIEYDGLSRPLTAVGALDPTLTTHSLKIAVSDTSDSVLDTGIFLSNLRGLSVEGGAGAGSTPDTPLLPPEGDDPSDGFDFEVFVGDLGFGIDPTNPIFFDPIVAVGYEFFSSLAVATVQVSSDLGDGIYELWVWDGSDYLSLGDLLVNEIFDFVAAGYNSVLQFKIDGIEESALVDPTDDTAFVTGLTFVGGGDLSFNMSPITVDTDAAGNNVSAPASLSLLLLGLLAIRRIKKV